jgi:mono/diheme cytochrome c family protein
VRRRAWQLSRSWGPHRARTLKAWGMRPWAAFAQQICSECHNIEKDQRPSPNGLAPNFDIIARTPGLTAIALTAGLRTSHRAMPNIIIPDDDLRNIVAYILSLQ